MNKSIIFFLCSLAITATVLAGCTGGGQPAPVKTTTSTPEITTTVVVEVPTTTEPVTTLAPLPVTTVTTTPSLVSADDIRNEFLNVAYTATNRLERLNARPGDSRVVISTVSAGSDDVSLIEQTVRDFNAASQTVKLSENIKDGGSGDILIKFLPEEGLSAINIDEVPQSGPLTELLTRKVLYQGTVPAAKIVRGTIYINTNLKSDARRHVIVRSLMYQMGLTGDTTEFADSVFYAGENTSTVLSVLDRKVITMLYADDFANGMTMEDLRKVIYLP